MKSKLIALSLALASACSGGPAAAEMDKAYSFNLESLLSVSGDNTYVPGLATYEATSGTLPPGITLSPTGVLSGTPTAPATFTFDVQATYKTKTASRMFSLKVAPRMATHLHMDGTQGSTSFPAAAGVAPTVINTTVNTTISRFGGGSAYMAGSSYLASPGGATLGSGDFTVEGWYYPTVASASTYLFSFGQYGVENHMMVRLISGVLKTGICNATKVCVYVGTGTGATPAINKWHHYALVKRGSTRYIYSDGNLIGTQADALNWTSSWGYRFGAGELNGNASYFFKGYLDETRLVIGQDVYAGVPTEPW